MNFSVALTNLLVLGTSFSTSYGNDIDHVQRYSGEVRDQLFQSLGNSVPAAAVATPPAVRSRQLMLHTDFSWLEGSWLDCMHTTLMTFNGKPADKHIVEEVGCEGGELGTVTRVGEGKQTVQMDIILLNHCWFHDLGGPDQPPCPNDELPNDTREGGNVKVKYSFKGIGSFAHPDQVELFTDHTSLMNPMTGDWEINFARAKIENEDKMVCTKHMDGVVCDWRINEYRTSTQMIPMCEKVGGKKRGCLDPTKNKYKNEKHCLKNNKNGNENFIWNEACEVIHTPNGFVYDSFGSYYLVQDMDESCAEICADKEPVEPVDPVDPDEPAEPVFGCYRGGNCIVKGNVNHGCCDCSEDLTEEKCAVSCDEEDTCGIWTGKCDGMCLPPPEM